MPFSLTCLVALYLVEYCLERSNKRCPVRSGKSEPALSIWNSQMTVIIVILICILQLPTIMTLLYELKTTSKLGTTVSLRLEGASQQVIGNENYSSHCDCVLMLKRQ